MGTEDYPGLIHSEDPKIVYANFSGVSVLHSAQRAFEQCLIHSALWSLFSPSASYSLRKRFPITNQGHTFLVESEK